MHTLHFHFFSKKAFAHEALSGKNLDEEQLDTGFFRARVASFDTEEFLLHTCPTDVADSAKKKKRSKSNYGLIHLLHFVWKASHLFIKCWRLSFIGLQPQMILIKTITLIQLH